MAEVVHGRQQAGSYWAKSVRITQRIPTNNNEWVKDNARIIDYILKTGI